MTELPLPQQAAPRWFRTTWGRLILIALGIIILLLGFFGYGVWNAYRRYQRGELDLSAYVARQTQANGTTNAMTQRVPRGQIETADDPAIGPDDALVTIVEFGDFECPFCRESFPIIQAMLERYGSRIRFIFRDFPNISIHPNALAAALAAACAADQGKFWPYHDLLYLNQERLETADLRTYAQTANLSLTQFDSCVASQEHRPEIEEDYQAALSAGVQGTPTWFVNGYRIQGAIPEDVFLQVIELGLAGKL